MKAEGMGATEIAKALKIGRASVYRESNGNSGAVARGEELRDDDEYASLTRRVATAGAVATLLARSLAIP
jgi:hypothetical protein